MMQRLGDLLLVRQGERHQVFYFLGLFFLVGAGMALGRGASEALFFKRFGIEYLPLMYLFSCFSLCLVSLLYAAFVDRLPSEKFYRIFFTLLALLLFANWFAITFSNSELVYPVFFLLYEVASELLLVHSAVYINQNFIQTQSKRLTPVILAGHQVGVITGGVFLAAASPVLGVVNMMLVWVTLLLLAWLLVRHWHAREGVSPYFRTGRKDRSKIRQSVTDVSQGLKFMRSSRLLRMSSFSLFFMVLSVYILAYSVNVVYTGAFATEESLGAFFGVLTATTGLLALLLQLFVTNRLIRDLGVKRVNYIFPLASIFSYAGLLLAFTLPAAIIASFNKETLLPAFAKPVRNIFNATLPPQLQGRGQAIAVIIVIPMGLAFAGILLLLAQGADNMYAFLVIGLLCSLAYLYFNREMNLAYAREILSNLKKSLFIPQSRNSRFLQGNHAELLRDIERGLMSSDAEISMVYARVLSKSEPQRAADLIPQKIATVDTATKDQLVKISAAIESAPLRECFRKQIGLGDAHLDATILKTLFRAQDESVKGSVRQLLQDANPRIKAAGVYGALCYPLPALFEEAISVWIALLQNAQVDNYMPAVELIVPEFESLYRQPPLLAAVQQALRRLLQHEDSRFIHIALNILAGWPAECLPGLNETVTSLAAHSSWLVRNACVRVFPLLPDDSAEVLLFNALEDPHPGVRITAVRQLAARQTDETVYVKNLLLNRQSGSPRAKQAMLEYLMTTGCDAGSLQSISLSLAREAVDLQAAGHDLSAVLSAGIDAGAVSVTTLLAFALQERALEVADLALYALQYGENDETLAVIRAGLKSRDQRQFAHACELLSMLNNPSLLALLMPLFDAVEAGTAATTKRRRQTGLPALLAWIEKSADPWLQECAAGLSAALSNTEHASV